MDVARKLIEILGIPYPEYALDTNFWLRCVEIQIQILDVASGDGGFERNDVVSQFFVQILDDADLDRTELGRTVRAFAQLYDPLSFKFLCQEVEIGKVSIKGDRANGPMILGQPRLLLARGWRKVGR